MNKEKRRVPKLRFPGFTEDWEQRKLIDTAKTFIGLVTTMTENYRDSGTLLIRNSDIKEGQFVFSEKPIHLDEEFAEKNKTRRLQIGDVVTVHTGDIGTSAVIQEKEAGAIGFATINTRTDKRILNPYFLSTYFNTEKHKCYANSVSTGDGRSNYNIKDFNKLVISIPTLDEQEKISALINNINTIITLHQRKLEYLNLKKKALLQKLFPKNGERYPELRFPGFTDAWEQRKLGDYLSIPEKEILEVASSDDLITVKLNLGGVELGASRDTLSLGSTVYYKRYAGQFIYGKQNFFNGSMGLIPTNLDGKGSSGDVPSFNVSNIEENYLYTYVSRESYWRSKEAAASGTGSKRIHEKTFLDFNIDVPSMEEQKLISNTFDLIDRFITLHQRKLEHLQLQKKALLQQMFV